MKRVEKTVFISYRRTNFPWALAIYQNLSNQGYDIFFDFNSIDSGDFEQIILGNIESRAHFLVLLTPSALKRCSEPGDWLRREIEYALEAQRNIVPLMFEGFDFSTPSIKKHLTGKLATLSRYNALRVPVEYFEEAMTRLSQRYLNVPLEMVVHPPSVEAMRAAQEQQVAASNAPEVQEESLTAQEWYERGCNLNDNSDDELFCYNESIRLKPDFADAYYNRGVVRNAQGDQDGALRDFNETIRLKPDLADAYNNRGVVRNAQGDQDGALQDYNKAIRLKSNDADAYYNRANMRKAQGDWDGALQDYNEAIRLKPDFSDAYNNRGTLRRLFLGDRDGALQDYNEAIRLEPNYIFPYFSRASLLERQGDLAGAIRDYQIYLDHGGGLQFGDQEEVEGYIRKLKNKPNES